MISDDNLGLNLCVVSTTCYEVIISERSESSEKRISLVRILVDFQTRDYRVSIGSYIMSL